MSVGKLRDSAPYNREHRKVLLSVRVPNRILRRDGNGKALLDARGKKSYITDGGADLDLSTLQSNGMILAFHDKTKKGGEKSSMISIDDLPDKMRTRVLDKARAPRNESGPPRDGRTLRLDPNAKPLPERVGDRFHFLSSSGKPKGRMEDFFEKYGDGTQVGTWTTPGNGTTGAGGIKTILDTNDRFHTAGVAPVKVRDADRKDGINGNATFVYGYVERLNEAGRVERQYMWTMKSANWWKTDKNGERKGKITTRRNMIGVP